MISEAVTTGMLLAHTPNSDLPKVESQAWTAQQIAGRWEDVDFEKKRISVNRGLVAVAYELQESRGETPNSRRAIDLDPTTLELEPWRE